MSYVCLIETRTLRALVLESSASHQLTLGTSFSELSGQLPFNEVTVQRTRAVIITDI